MFDVWKQMWREAYQDSNRGETVATREFFMLDVHQGEVLRDPRKQRRFDLEEMIGKWYSYAEK